MNFREVLAANFRFENLIFIALHVIFIAVIFEFVAWWLGRRIEKWTTPLIPGDSGREHNWRIRRRTTLRQTPKVLTRSLCYVIAAILVFDVFGVPVLPLSIGVAAVALIFGSAVLPILRDNTQGYALLAEDTLAPGDVVEINEKRGVVEKVTLRGVWLAAENGQTHAISNREISSVTMLKRNIELATNSDLPPLASRQNPRQR